MLRVKSILSLKNGFINREEFPDYGVDLDIELITDGKNASARKFAVQIKSAEKLNTVKKNGKDFFAFSFATSRLNYLRKRDLGFGILVLYDEATETCYFDYVFELIKRVEEFNPTKDWYAQQKVTVYIAPAQVLNVAAALEIHQTVLGHYERHQLLMRTHGSRYNLPGFEETSPTAAVPKVDFNNPAQVVELLEKYGGALFNQQQFSMLLDLFSKLPAATINASSTLTFLAAVTHGQVGDLVEGEYYLAKSKHHLHQLDEESKVLLEFTRVRLDFLRGNLDIAAYAERINDLAARSSSLLNGLVLRINTLYLAVVDNRDWSNEQELATRIEALFAQITDSALDEAMKTLLTLYNSESLQILGSSIYLQEATLLKAQEELQVLALDPARMARIQKSVDRLTQAKHYAHSAYQYAQQHADDYLQANAAQYLSRYFLSTEFDLMILQIEDNLPLTLQKEQQYISHMNLAGEAYNRFDELNLWKDAHQTLVNMAELQSIFLLRYGKSIGTKTHAEVLERIQQLGDKLGLSPFESVITATHQQIKSMLNPWQNIGKVGSVEEYAHKILLLHNLPAERLPHIIADLQSQMIFEDKCNNPRIQLLNNISLRDNPETAYTQPVSYVLRDSVTGQFSEPSTDIHQLLALLPSFPEGS